MSIKIQALTKVYGSQKAIDDISFDINTGEIVGFLGPNGAGKSTTMKIITGYLEATAGRIEVNGLNVATQSNEVRWQIGYLPEHNPLYTEMYVKEFLKFVGNLYGVDSRARIEDMIAMCGLQAEQHKKIGQLSKGYRQRVGLAQALIHNPAVLILDEPTTGLDPNQIIEIRNLIKSVSQEKTILFSSHIMQEVEALCDRVVIINKGKIVANDTLEKLKSQGESLEAVFKNFTMQ